MSQEDIDYLDKQFEQNIKNELEATEKPSNMTDEEWDEANTLFMKGIDNLAVGAYAGFEEDENGNITFDPAMFAAGLGGYTAVKEIAKNPTIRRELKGYIERRLNEFENKPYSQFVTGTQRAVDGGVSYRKSKLTMLP